MSEFVSGDSTVNQLVDIIKRSVKHETRVSAISCDLFL